MIENGRSLPNFTLPTETVARAEGAGADRDLVGVAVLEAHALRRNAELVGDDLPIGGAVALAVVVRAHRDGEIAGLIEAQFRMLNQAGV